MSIFSRKTRVYVSSMAYQLGESDPDSLASNTLIAIVSQTPMSAMLKNMAVSGMANKVRLARKYAKETYTLGLPSGNFKSMQEIDDTAMALLVAADIGYALGVVIDSTTVAPLIPYHFVREYLLNTRGWDEANNDITIFPPSTLPNGPALEYAHPTTHTCELTSINPNDAGTEATIVYTIHSSQAAYSKTKIGVDNQDRIIDRSGWFQTVFNSQTVEETFPLPSGYILGEDYYIVTYKKVIAGGFEPTVYTWYYRIGSAVYSELDEVEDIVDTYSGMPVIPMRYNNVDMCSVGKQGTALFNTSEKLLDILGLNILDIASSINTSDNVTEIDHAYIMFGIDMQTVNQSSIIYLVHFFDKLADSAVQSQFGSAIASLADAGSVELRSSYSISNQYTPSTTGDTLSLTEHGLDLKISYNWIISELRVGNIGKKGFATKEYIRQDISKDNIKTGIFSDQGEFDESRLILKLQITDNIYQYVEVEGLRSTNRVYSTLSVYTTLTNVIDDTNEHNLVIPIDYNISMNLGILKRNALYEESLQLIMNSVEFVEEEWYETGLFKIVSFIVIAVITYFSWGTLGPALSAAFVSLQAFTQFLVMSIILGVVMKKAFAWLASTIGAEWMAIIGVFVAAVTIYFVPQGSFTVMGQSIGTAEMCLNMSVSMVESATEEINSQIEDIGQEYDQFMITSAEQMKILEDAQELLEVDPLGTNLLYAQTNRFEAHPLSNDPEMFYAMTIHTGNIGTVVLDIIPQYHTIKTTLPTAQESLGQIGGQYGSIG